MGDQLKKERKPLIVMGDLPKSKKKVLQGWHERAQRCTVPEMGGSKEHSKRRWGLEGALKKRWGLKGSLKRMVEGSKAHSKEVRARMHTQKDGRGLEGALEGDEGSKAH
jgi:hypothetical protein